MSLGSIAQDFQGKAFYKSKTTMDMSNFGNDISEERKKQIAARLKSAFDKTYILTFNKTESLYKEEERLDAPGGGGRGFGFFSAGGGAHYKNVKKQELRQEQEFFGKQFLVKDSLAKLEWVMGSETKQIGKYTAFKATAVKDAGGFDPSSFRRGRRGGRDANQEKDSTASKNKVEVPRKINVVAWYTPQIPINQGPGDYWGLPGLILEVQADRTTILCTKIVMNPDDKKEMKIPSKGKEVTKKEYDKTVKKKIEELRESRGGRNGRGGGGGGGRRN